MPLAEWSRLAAEAEERFVHLLRRLVEVSSRSGDSAGTAACADVLAEAVAEVVGTGPAHVERVPCPGHGPALRARMPGGEGPRTLVIGHTDTVWDAAEFAPRFRVDEGRAYGSGVLDMKGGLAQCVCALGLLRQAGQGPAGEVVFLAVPDEEVGSPASRSLTEETARACQRVFVLEPGTGPRGLLKTARKGIARYRLTVHGSPSHAGVDFAAGASAVLEMARQIERVAALTQLDRGITVNPGVVRGGTQSNVVADRAELDIDVRVPTPEDALAVDAALRALQPVDTRCRLVWDGGLDRPPMVRSEAIAALAATAIAQARQMGFALGESATGGGSDGNFTAALGIPTLDGLGMVGAGAHTREEHIELAWVPRRVALLAALLATA